MNKTSEIWPTCNTGFDIEGYEQGNVTPYKIKMKQADALIRRLLNLLNPDEIEEEFPDKLVEEWYNDHPQDRETSNSSGTP